MGNALFVFLLTILFAVVFFFWRRERNYLKRKTSETMRTEVWEEILAERQQALKQRRQFRDTLEQVRSKSNH